MESDMIDHLLLCKYPAFQLCMFLILCSRHYPLFRTSLFNRSIFFSQIVHLINFHSFYFYEGTFMCQPPCHLYVVKSFHLHHVHIWSPHFTSVSPFSICQFLQNMDCRRFPGIPPVYSAFFCIMTFVFKHLFAQRNHARNHMLCSLNSVC